MAEAVSEETWAAIESVYRSTHDSEIAIAKRFGVHHLAVYQRARAKGWTRPVGAAPETPADPARLPAAPVLPEAPVQAPGAAATRTAKSKPKSKPKPKKVATAREARDELIRRMYGAIATKLTKLEERMADDQPTMTPEESERHTREIGSMIQGFEKVTEVATDAAKSDAAVRPLQPNIVTLADIDRVRRELAERLHRAWGRKDG